MVINKKSETIIYYAAAISNTEIYDLNHLYLPVKSLYEETLAKKVDLKDNVNDYIRCPGFSDLAKNTFVHRVPLDVHATLDFKNKRANYIFKNQLDQHKTKVKLDFMREPTLHDHNLIQLSWPIIFFSEEDSMMATLTPPYFEKVSSSEYGVTVPGRFDIGKWFRPMNTEFQLWPGVNEIKVSANEALCYIHFDTNKKIIFRKFIMSKEMDRLLVSILKASPFRRYAKLSDRYKIFEQSQSKERILKLIQKQLI